MTTAKRPDLPEFLALAFSPEAASALTETNALARQLRDMPASLLTDEIRNDRERVLGEHLADLLAAHRDARAAGATTADAELVEGLEHVREEVSRIIGACRARANDTLATQRGFLEARYPAAADDMLAALPAVPAAVEAKSVNDANGEHRKLTADALDALLPAKASTPPVAPRQSAPSRPVGKGTAIAKAGAHEWDAKNVVVAIICIAFLAGFLIWFVSNLNAMDEAEKEQLSVKDVAVTAVIDRFVRGKGSDDEKYGPWYPTGEIDVHGTVENKSKLEAEQVVLKFDYLVCPDVPQPKLASCKPLTSFEYNVAQDTDLPAGVTTKYKVSFAPRIPDVIGRLRARVTLIKASSESPAVGFGY